MKPYTEHCGLVATLDRINVDTDQIIPKQFLKRIERSGFGPYLFYDWRHLPNGSLNPDFELNQPRFRGATILLTRANFGCGSSREHAPWALLDAGFRSLIAPSFSDIFYANCFQNGILPVRLPDPHVDALFERTQKISDYRLTVNLQAQSVRDDSGLEFRFEIDPFRRECLLRGLDDIALTLQHEDRIREYECFKRYYE